MIYFVVALVFILYLEFLGRAFLSLIKKELNLFGMPVGFILLFASTYICTSVLTAMNCSFYIILIIYSVIVLLSFILIYRKLNCIDYSVDWKYLLLLLAMVTIMLCYAFNTTLGDLNGFDSTYYLNMVTSNIGLNPLNSKHVYFATEIDNPAYSYMYTFQTYYYFVSTMMYIVGGVCGKIGINFFASTAYIWVFQIVFNLLLGSIVLEALNKFFKNNLIVIVFVWLLFTFSYGKIYFNNVFGFYGNSIRTIIISYAILYCIEYIENRKRSDKLLFALSVMCACSLSSTGVFLVFFMLYALFFVLQDEKCLFKEYGLLLLIPCINLVAIVINNLGIAVISGVIVFLVLWFYNDTFEKLFLNKYSRHIILIISFVLMFVLSYLVTKNIFDFTALFDNLSESADMTLDYFDYNYGWNIIKIYKLLSLILLLGSIVFVNNNAFVKYVLVLILVFFNPFCCSILNEINTVYYRAYELILNPYTIIYMMNIIRLKILKNKVFNTTILVLLFVLIVNINFKEILYWHDSFIPKENYNYIYKISNDEYDIITELKNHINYKKNTNPKIVTTNILTQSFIPNGEYYFGRGYEIEDSWSKSEYQLYAMFWPIEYFGDTRQPDDVDYDNMCLYIKDASVDYIVQDKNIDYYDQNKDIWYSMIYKINECGVYPFYENERYSLYYYGE